MFTAPAHCYQAISLQLVDGGATSVSQSKNDLCYKFVLLTFVQNEKQLWRPMSAIGVGL